MPVVARPFINAAETQEVAVIFEKFFKARAGHVSEFDFGFLGSARSLAAFENVLFARAGRLDHLVASAVVPVEKTFTKTDGAIIDDPGLLEGVEMFVAAVRRDETGVTADRSMC